MTIHGHLTDHSDATFPLAVYELPKYLAAASQLTVQREDVADFTQAVLQFWRSHASQLPHWSLAARLMFAMSPSSAACERVFSLLESTFGRDQLRALSDYVD